MNLSEIACELSNAKKSRTPIPAFVQRGISLSVEDAYEVQNTLLMQALDDGEKLIGHKMGLTSKAKQKDVGVFEPIRGFLLRSMESQERTLLLDEFIQPRVEPEVAIVLGKPLCENPTLYEIERAIEGIFPALEILDSRYLNFSFSLSDVIADNTSAAKFILGTKRLDGDELNFLPVSVRKQGKIEQTGCPIAVLGHPYHSVRALCIQLSRHGQYLKEGQMILTGGITAAIPVKGEESIEVRFGSYSMHFIGKDNRAKSH